MSAAEALRAARAAGVSVGIDGDDLVLQASAPPAPTVLDALACHKAEIVELLRLESEGWTAEDWQAFLDERAGVAEFDGGLPRAQAEVQAFACCVTEWLNRHPVQSAPERCLGCGGGDHAHDPLLRFGTETSGHAWLHSACWPAWHQARQAKACAMLSAMGIPVPSKFPDDFEKNGGA